MIEFITGTLPWKGKNKEIIGQLKQDLTNPKLFEECPPHLLRIFHHLKSLRYGDLPDYDLIETAFDHILDDLTLEASGVPTSKSFEDMMSDRMSEDVDVAVAEEEDEDAVVLDDDDDEQTGNANNHLAPMLITSPARSLKKVGIKDFKEGATTLMESSTVPVTLKAVLGSPPKTILTRSQAAAMAAVHAVQSLVPRYVPRSL